jgi:hypothetical protein
MGGASKCVSLVFSAPSEGVLQYVNKLPKMMFRALQKHTGSCNSELLAKDFAALPKMKSYIGVTG